MLNSSAPIGSAVVVDFSFSHSIVASSWSSLAAMSPSPFAARNKTDSLISNRHNESNFILTNSQRLVTMAPNVQRSVQNKREQSIELPASLMMELVARCYHNEAANNCKLKWFNRNQLTKQLNLFKVSFETKSPRL